MNFVRDCPIQGSRLAVESRGMTDFADLTWNRQSGSIEIELWLDAERHRSPSFNRMATPPQAWFGTAAISAEGG